MASQSDLQPGVEEIAAFVDDSVFTQLSAKLGDAKEGNEGALEKKPLRIDKYLKKYRDAGLRVSQKEFNGCLEVKIGIVYEHPDVTVDLAETITVKTIEDLLAKFVPEDNPLITKLGEDEMIRLSDAFTKVTYVGKAQDDLAEYLRDCWKEYNPAKYKAPCVAVVQSSGFGKSRTVRELALKAEREPNLNLKVLYMCARVHRSTGFPEATSKLRDSLFDPAASSVQEVARRLKAIYCYAKDHWADVQTEWLELFIDNATDSSDPDGKMVVLVIDEARSLLAEVDGKKNDFRILRNALKSANEDIGPEGGIFGVLIDTNSQISDLTPPLLLDPSSRKSGGSLASFAPLVLADTMDAHWDDYFEDEEINEGTQVAVGAEDEEKTKQQERAKIAMYKTVVTGSDALTPIQLIKFA
ncbi:hypothetical protein PHYSODRAFT_342575 [Phytophthora sojae]|uniref:Uncharacterized protein n=1 Tax=Phytophthora sojae (strain P6497) TaxID=1094619 RepID=G5AH06_PHYSP|nr:hypothetical protein PHYSODRAFT_342575 [Phytophthora sojae]EGZ05199.1 hypothetical protein PHYSODRAFT_342575 [Phytophthora sojae]|eukprot:XP_009539357.1 hypothetical protein PHYSODRAFT_342575 [Phytophthora sojae]